MNEYRVDFQHFYTGGVCRDLRQMYVNADTPYKAMMIVWQKFPTWNIHLVNLIDSSTKKVVKQYGQKYFLSHSYKDNCS